MRRVFFCYAFGKEGAWEALCLDLDIAVHGRSFEQADERLKTAIKEYVEAIADLPTDDKNRLLNRSVPFSERAKFAWRFLKSLFRNRGDDGCHHHYTLPSAVSAI